MEDRYLDSLIPIRPKLAAGECLTSWLFRITEGLSCSIEELLNALGGRKNSRVVRSSDFELGVLDKLLVRLAKATGSAVEELRGSTCLQIAEYTSTSSNRGYALPASSWVLLPAKLYSVAALPHHLTEKHVLGGLQYCPDCLRVQGVTLPLAWRLAFVTVCPIHKRLLACCCPHCGQDVDFSFKRGKRSLSEGPLRRHICRHCSGDLSEENPSRTGQPLTASQLRYLVFFQELHFLLLKQSVKEEAPLVKDYFQLLEWLVNLHFPRRRKITGAATSFGHFLGHTAKIKAFDPPRLIPQGRHTFRTYSTTDRAKVLLMTSVMLDPWPEHFITIRKRSSFLENALAWESAFLFPQYLMDPISSRTPGKATNPFGSSLAHYVLHLCEPESVSNQGGRYISVYWRRKALNIGVKIAEAQEYQARAGIEIPLGDRLGY